MMDKNSESTYETLEDGSIGDDYDDTNNCYCKWLAQFYYIGTPLVALVFLILAALHAWPDDNMNTCITIGTSIYIICHWGCYVVKWD